MSTSLPSYVHDLVDDAAIFPPGNAPLDEAVAAHRRHRASPHAEMLGPFVVSDTRLPDLARLVERVETTPLDVTVVVTGGAGAIEPAVTWASRTHGVALAGVEVAMRESDAGDLAPTPGGSSPRSTSSAWTSRSPSRSPGCTAPSRPPPG